MAINRESVRRMLSRFDDFLEAMDKADAAGQQFPGRTDIESIMELIRSDMSAIGSTSEIPPKTLERMRVLTNTLERHAPESKDLLDSIDIVARNLKPGPRIAIVGNSISQKRVGFKSPDFTQQMVNEFVAGLPKDATIVSGAASGVDSYAGAAAKRYGLALREYPVKWPSRSLRDTDPQLYDELFKKARAEAFARNTTIAKEADIVVAFWDGKSGGTGDTVGKARRMGKQLSIVDIDTGEVKEGERFLASIHDGYAPHDVSRPARVIRPGFSPEAEKLRWRIPEDKRQSQLSLDLEQIHRQQQAAPAAPTTKTRWRANERQMSMQPDEIFVGRGSKWGNPFHPDAKDPAFRVATAEEAVRKYETWLRGQPELMDQLSDLKGKSLVYQTRWPQSKFSHAEVLARLADEFEPRPLAAQWDRVKRVISIDLAAAKEAYAAKAWRRPRVPGVTPLPDSLFPTLNSWIRFLLEHERAHADFDRRYPAIKRPRVAIIGSTQFNNKVAIEQFVASLPKDAVVVTSGSPGAGEIAEAAARKRKLEVVKIETVVAPGEPAAKALARRNRSIIEGCDYFTAFWNEKSSPVKDAFETAIQMNKRVAVVNDEGIVIRGAQHVAAMARKVGLAFYEDKVNRFAVRAMQTAMKKLDYPVRFVGRGALGIGKRAAGPLGIILSASELANAMDAISEEYGKELTKSPQSRDILGATGRLIERGAAAQAFMDVPTAEPSVGQLSQLQYWNAKRQEAIEAGDVVGRPAEAPKGNLPMVERAMQAANNVTLSSVAVPIEEPYDIRVAKYDSWNRQVAKQMRAAEHLGIRATEDTALGAVQLMNIMPRLGVAFTGTLEHPDFEPGAWPDLERIEDAVKLFKGPLYLPMLPKPYGRNFEIFKEEWESPRAREWKFHNLFSFDWWTRAMYANTKVGERIFTHPNIKLLGSATIAQLLELGTLGKIKTSDDDLLAEHFKNKDLYYSRGPFLEWGQYFNDDSPAYQEYKEKWGWLVTDIPASVAIDWYGLPFMVVANIFRAEQRASKLAGGLSRIPGLAKTANEIEDFIVPRMAQTPILRHLSAKTELHRLVGKMHSGMTDAEILNYIDGQFVGYFSPNLARIVKDQLDQGMKPQVADLLRTWGLRPRNDFDHVYDLFPKGLKSEPDTPTLRGIRNYGRDAMNRHDRLQAHKMTSAKEFKKGINVLMREPKKMQDFVDLWALRKDVTMLELQQQALSGQRVWDKDAVELFVKMRESGIRSDWWERSVAWTERDAVRMQNIEKKLLAASDEHHKLLMLEKLTPEQRERAEAIKRGYQSAQAAIDKMDTSINETAKLTAKARKDINSVETAISKLQKERDALGTADDFVAAGLKKNRGANPDELFQAWLAKDDAIAARLTPQLEALERMKGKYSGEFSKLASLQEERVVLVKRRDELLPKERILSRQVFVDEARSKQIRELGALVPNLREQEMAAMQKSHGLLETYERQGRRDRQAIIKAIYDKMERTGDKDEAARLFQMIEDDDVWGLELHVRSTTPKTSTTRTLPPMHPEDAIIRDRAQNIQRMRKAVSEAGEETRVLRERIDATIHERNELIDTRFRGEVKQVTVPAEAAERGMDIGRQRFTQIAELATMDRKTFEAAAAKGKVHAPTGINTKFEDDLLAAEERGVLVSSAQKGAAAGLPKEDIAAYYLRVADGDSHAAYQHMLEDAVIWKYWVPPENLTDYKHLRQLKESMVHPNTMPVEVFDSVHADDVFDWITGVPAELPPKLKKEILTEWRDLPPLRQAYWLSAGQFAMAGKNIARKRSVVGQYRAYLKERTAEDLLDGKQLTEAFGMEFVRDSLIKAYDSILSRPISETSETTLINMSKMAKERLAAIRAASPEEFAGYDNWMRLQHHFQDTAESIDEALKFDPTKPRTKLESVVAYYEVLLRSLKQSWLFLSGGYYTHNAFDNPQKSALSVGLLEWMTHKHNATPVYGHELLSGKAGFTGMASARKTMLGQRGSSVTLPGWLPKSLRGQSVSGLLDLPGFKQTIGPHLENIAETIELQSRDKLYQIAYWRKIREVDAKNAEFIRAGQYDSVVKAKDAHALGTEAAHKLVSDVLFFSDDPAPYVYALGRIFPFLDSFVLPNLKFWTQMSLEKPWITAAYVQFREGLRQRHLEGGEETRAYNAMGYLHVPGTNEYVNPASSPLFLSSLDPIHRGLYKSPHPWRRWDGKYDPSMEQASRAIAITMGNVTGLRNKSIITQLYHLGKGIYDKSVGTPEGEDKDGQPRYNDKDFWMSANSLFSTFNRWSLLLSNKTLQEHAFEHDFHDEPNRDSAIERGTRMEQAIQYMLDTRALQASGKLPATPPGVSTYVDENGVERELSEHANAPALRDPAEMRARFLTRRSRAAAWRMIGVDGRNDPEGVMFSLQYLGDLARFSDTIEDMNYVRRLGGRGPNGQYLMDFILGTRGEGLDPAQREFQQKWFKMDWEQKAELLESGDAEDMLKDNPQSTMMRYFKKFPEQFVDAIRGIKDSGVWSNMSVAFKTITRPIVEELTTSRGLVGEAAAERPREEIRTRIKGQPFPSRAERSDKNILEVTRPGKPPLRINVSSIAGPAVPGSPEPERSIALDSKPSSEASVATRTTKTPSGIVVRETLTRPTDAEAFRSLVEELRNEFKHAAFVPPQLTGDQAARMSTFVDESGRLRMDPRMTKGPEDVAATFTGFVLPFPMVFENQMSILSNRARNFIAKNPQAQLTDALRDLDESMRQSYNALSLTWMDANTPEKLEAFNRASIPTKNGMFNLSYWAQPVKFSADAPAIPRFVLFYSHALIYKPEFVSKKVLFQPSMTSGASSYGVSLAQYYTTGKIPYSVEASLRERKDARSKIYGGWPERLKHSAYNPSELPPDAVTMLIQKQMSLPEGDPNKLPSSFWNDLDMDGHATIVSEFALSRHVHTQLRGINQYLDHPDGRGIDESTVQHLMGTPQGEHALRTIALVRKDVAEYLRKTRGMTVNMTEEAAFIGMNFRHEVGALRVDDPAYDEKVDIAVKGDPTLQLALSAERRAELKQERFNNLMGLVPSIKALLPGQKPKAGTYMAGGTSDAVEEPLTIESLRKAGVSIPGVTDSIERAAPSEPSSVSEAALAGILSLPTDTTLPAPEPTRRDLSPLFQIDFGTLPDWEQAKSEKYPVPYGELTLGRMTQMIPQVTKFEVESRARAVGRNTVTRLELRNQTLPENLRYTPGEIQQIGELAVQMDPLRPNLYTVGLRWMGALDVRDQVAAASHLLDIGVYFGAFPRGTGRSIKAGLNQADAAGLGSQMAQQVIGITGAMEWTKTNEQFAIDFAKNASPSMKAFAGASSVTGATLSITSGILASQGQKDAAVVTGAAGGALSGAAYGATFGPWGAAIGAIVGGTLGGLAASQHPQEDEEERRRREEFERQRREAQMRQERAYNIRSAISRERTLTQQYASMARASYQGQATNRLLQFYRRPQYQSSLGLVPQVEREAARQFRPRY